MPGSSEVCQGPACSEAEGAQQKWIAEAHILNELLLILMIFENN